MHNLETHLNKASKEVRLSRNEKSAMRASLMHAMRGTHVPTPYWSMFASPVFMRAGAAFMLVVILGGTTALASEHALPGDALYPVKIGLLENAGGALAQTPQAAASWNTKIATRRAEEAEALAVRGTLSSAAAEELQQRITESVAKAEEASQKISDIDSDDAARLSTELDSSLSAHGEILAQLSDSSKDGNTRTAANTLARFLHARRGSDDAIAVATFAAVEATSTAPLAKGKPNSGRVTSFKNAGSDSIKDAREKLKALRSSFTASTTSSVERRISQIEHKIGSATNTDSVTEALQDATRIRTLLDASERLNRDDFVGSSLEESDDGSDNSGKSGEDSDSSGSGKGN